jgi:preprotein translocase subunit SecE
MSDEKKKDPNKKIFFVEKFQEFRAEFRKIVWPDRPTLIKHTITVITISLIFGALITLMDAIFGVLFTSFVQLVV